MAKIDYNIFGDPRKGQNLTYQAKNMRGIMEYHLKREIDDTLNDIINNDNGFNIESLNLNKLITDKMKDNIAKKIELTINDCVCQTEIAHKINKAGKYHNCCLNLSVSVSWRKF